MRRPLDPFWLAAPSRFAALPARTARVALALAVFLLLACSAALSVPAGTESVRTSDVTDVALYGEIVDGIRHGGNYYRVAADALRANNYPLKPFVTFRLPTLAVVEAHLPVWAIAGLLGVLVTAVLIAWYGRLTAAVSRIPPRIAVALTMAGGLVVYAQAPLVVFHEIWAGLLIALSLAMRRPGRWVEAAALGLAAMVIRETAALYVVVMAALAFAEGERREAIGWGVSLSLFAVVVALHAHAVAEVVRPLDPASPGWAGLLGFGYFVRTVVISTALTLLPMPVAALLVGLALIGWAGWRDAFALRVSAVLVAYAVLLSLFGRADTFYWGLLVVPMLLPGLVLAPDAVRDLVGAALDKRRITVRRVVR